MTDSYIFHIKNVKIAEVEPGKVHFLVCDKDKPVGVSLSAGQYMDGKFSDEVDHRKCYKIHLRDFSAEEAVKELTPFLKDVSERLQKRPGAVISEYVEDKEPVIIPKEYIRERYVTENIYDEYGGLDSGARSGYITQNLVVNDFPYNQKKFEDVFDLEYREDGSLAVYFVNPDAVEFSSKFVDKKPELQDWVNNPVRDVLADKAKYPVIPKICHEIIPDTFIDVEATNNDPQNRANNVYCAEFENGSGCGLSFVAPTPDKQLNVHLSSHRPDGIKVEAVVPVTYLESEEIIKPVGYLESKKDGRSLFTGIVKDKSYSEHHSSFTITTADGKEISNLWKGKTAEGRPIPVKELDMETAFALVKNPYDKKFRDLMPSVWMELSAEEVKNVKYAKSNESTKGAIVFDNLNNGFKAKLDCDVLDVRKDGSMEILFPVMQKIGVNTAEGNMDITVMGKEDVFWLLNKNREKNLVLANHNTQIRSKGIRNKVMEGSHTSATEKDIQSAKIKQEERIRRARLEASRKRREKAEHGRKPSTRK